ncbi:MAG: hypothetical protein ACD_65C00101G0002 [uncultured bacterium]|nr:MAG: hypothetical protein ACD_65C00101G0002 [uncultured bacterium]
MYLAPWLLKVHTSHCTPRTSPDNFYRKNPRTRKVPSAPRKFSKHLHIRIPDIWEPSQVSALQAPQYPRLNSGSHFYDQPPRQQFPLNQQSARYKKRHVKDRKYPENSREIGKPRKSPPRETRKILTYNSGPPTRRPQQTPRATQTRILSEKNPPREISRAKNRKPQAEME